MGNLGGSRIKVKNLLWLLAWLPAAAGFAQPSGSGGRDFTSHPASNAPRVTNSSQIQLGAVELIGSYAVSDGPHWEDDETVAYTCLEGCALVFGGEADNYQCSTSDSSIDNMAWADGWANFSHCKGQGNDPVAEDFKVGGPTDCGEDDCYFSAYVDDHGCDESINYCYADPAVVPATPLWALAALLSILVALGSLAATRP